MPAVRIDSTPLIAGACVVSAYPGHGVRGADVPSAGEHGPAILYPGLVLPAEADDEFRLLILTRPGTLPGLVIREDSSVEVPEGSPAGTHVGTMRGYKNGAVFGTDPQTYTITIGAAEIAGDAVADGPTAAGGLESAAQLSGDAPIDEPTAAGGLDSAAQLSGDAAIDEPSASGGLNSAPNSSIAGDAVIDEPTAAGGLAGAAELSGNAQIDEPTAAGGLAADAAAGISGDAQTEEPSASGGFSGPSELGGNAQPEEPYAGGGFSGGGPVVPPRALLEESGLTRIIRSDRRTPTKLAALDVSEVDDLYFDFAPSATSMDPVQAVTVTCEARVGSDPAAPAMRVGLPVHSTDAAVQRIQAGVVGVTYLVRGVATLASGRQVVAAAFLPVVRRL